MRGIRGSNVGMRGSKRPSPKRWEMRWQILRSARQPGSPGSSKPGVIVLAICGRRSAATNCSTRSCSIGWATMAHPRPVSIGKAWRVGQTLEAPLRGPAVRCSRRKSSSLRVGGSRDCFPIFPIGARLNGAVILPPWNSTSCSSPKSGRALHCSDRTLPKGMQSGPLDFHGQNMAFPMKCVLFLR